jgi:DNA-binding CsgD family transcriptional regulator
VDGIRHHCQHGDAGRRRRRAAAAAPEHRDENESDDRCGALHRSCPDSRVAWPPGSVCAGSTARSIGACAAAMCASTSARSSSAVAPEAVYPQLHCTVFIAPRVRVRSRAFIVHLRQLHGRTTIDPLSQPLVVVEASERALARAVREVEQAGARVVEGWRHDGTVVCTGVVRDEADAAEALLAVVAGAGLVVHAQAERDVIDRLVDDLRRFGPVDHRTAEPAPGPGLTADERRLLDLLAEGRTLGDAAKELHLSRRTADRRLASARVKLDVATTAEAVVAYVTAVAHS